MVNRLETTANVTLDIIVSLSDSLREIQTEIQPFLTEATSYLFKMMHEEKGCLDALKKQSLLGVCRAVRQADLQGADDEILYKSFTYWDVDLDRWHVLIEKGDETFFEDQNTVVGHG